MKYNRTSRFARLACWAAVAVTAACWIPAIARAAASLSPIGDVVAAKKDKDKDKDKAMNNDQKRKLSRAAFDITPLSKAAIDKLAEKLSPEDAKVILRKGTEAPFCGNLLDNKKEGTYICKLCNLPLFASNTKFDSGTGWPSFFAPFAPDHIKYVKDKAHGMDRNEILCARCDAHLGHVFEDGPAPTGLRYCLNSASMDFVEKGKDLPYKAAVEVTETAYFAGGCFWGTEDHFQQIPGVINAVSGYQGGKVKNPTYKQVCSGDTGHTETVMVVFDPKAVEYTKLLEWFFKLHDPTTMNRQGPDVGSQYRSAIFTSTDKQFNEAKAFLGTNSTWRGKKVVTELKKVSDAGRFYDAELYHQDYHEKNGGSCPLPAAEVKETVKAPVK